MCARVSGARLELRAGPDLPGSQHRDWARSAARRPPAHHEAVARPSAKWLIPSPGLDDAYDCFVLAAESALAQREGRTASAAASRARWQVTVQAERAAAPPHYLFNSRAAGWWSTVVARLGELALYLREERGAHHRAQEVRRRCLATIPAFALLVDPTFVANDWMELLRGNSRRGELGRFRYRGRPARQT